MQGLLLCDRRNYDRSIAGPGTGRAERYFASDLDRLSDHVRRQGIAAIEVAAGSVQQTVPHALGHYSDAVLVQIDWIASNCKAK
jgi:hypothetical protein